MKMQLPTEIERAIAPLMEALPPDQTMTQLVVEKPGPTGIVEGVVQSPAIASNPALAAGLWLYVDQLDRSHEISQQMKDATGSFWHGIVHRREGDFGNSHYWFRKTGRHGAMDEIEGYDGHTFIDDVEAAHRRGRAPDELIDLQRREWAALFQWCAGQGER